MTGTADDAIDLDGTPEIVAVDVDLEFTLLYRRHRDGAADASRPTPRGVLDPCERRLWGGSPAGPGCCDPMASGEAYTPPAP